MLDNYKLKTLRKSNNCEIFRCIIKPPRKITFVDIFRKHIVGNIQSRPQVWMDTQHHPFNMARKIEQHSA